MLWSSVLDSGSMMTTFEISSSGMTMTSFSSQKKKQYQAMQAGREKEGRGLEGQGVKVKGGGVQDE